MSRFYFDIFDGEDEVRDIVGVDCDTPQQVREEAVSALPDMARDELPNGPDRTFWVKVRDAAGRKVFEASLVLTSKWIAEHDVFSSARLPK